MEERKIKSYLVFFKDYRVFSKNYLAFCIDGIGVLIVGGVLTLVFLTFIESINSNLSESIVEFMLKGANTSLQYCFMISFNATIQEVFFSTTLGKKICGLVVTTDEYKRPKKSQIIVRNLLYPLDTFWVIGSFPLLKGNGKTFGGYISKTKLVRKKELERL